MGAREGSSPGQGSPGRRAGDVPQGRLCRPPQRAVWQWPVPVHLSEPAGKPLSLHAPRQSSISCPDC